MFKVYLHNSSDEISEYATPMLQYAKRYADLYREEFPFVEIIACTDSGERVIETFGARPRKQSEQE